MSFARLKILLANRQPHLEQVGVRFSVLEEAVREFEAMCDRICQCSCGERAAFDLNAHLETPSRSNPISAAFAVNARSVL